MAEKAPLPLVLWQTWALLGLLASAISGARLVAAHSVALGRSSMVVPAKGEPARATAADIAGTAPAVDRVQARLKVAQSSTELCELLGRLAPSEELETTYAITEALDRNQLRSVRECGAQALSHQPTPAAQSWLIDLAEDPDPGVHSVALDALAAHGDSAAQAVVLEATHSEDADIRSSAVMALLKAQRPDGFSSARALLSSIDDRDALLDLVDALGESHDARALPVLSALVAQGERQVHLHAIAALGVLGQESGAPLLDALLEIGSKEEYSEAARALVKLAPGAALSKLRATLHSGNAERSRLALSVIAGLDLPGVAPLLSEALRSGDPVLASVVLRRLEREPNAALEAEVTELLGQGDVSLQRSAIRALSRLATPTAIATLRKAQLTEGATDWTSNALAQIPELADEVRAQRLAAFEKTGSSHALMALVRDPSPSVQASLLNHFAGPERNPLELGLVIESAPTSTVEQLVAGAGALAADQRRAMIDGLAKRGDPRFSEQLRNAARDDDEETRHNAIQALVNLGDEHARAMIDELARATEAGDRAFAAELLGARTDPAAARELEALGSDPSVQVTNTALNALQARSPELAAKLALRAYRGASAEDRPGLLASLSGLRGNLMRPIYDLALSDSNDEAAVGAVNSLGALGGPESAQRLLSVINDSSRGHELRVAAAQALHTLGGPLARSNRALIDALREPGEPEPYVCQVKN